MASVKPNVTPNVSSGSPLITPGWPLVSVQQSNPVAAAELAEGTTQTPSVATARATAIKNSGHQVDRID